MRIGKKFNATFHYIAFSLQFTNPPESCNVLIYLFSNNDKMAEWKHWRIEDRKSTINYSEKLNLLNSST